MFRFKRGHAVSSTTKGVDSVSYDLRIPKEERRELELCAQDQGWHLNVEVPLSLEVLLLFDSCTKNNVKWQYVHVKLHSHPVP